MRENYGSRDRALCRFNSAVERAVEYLIDLEVQKVYGYPQRNDQRLRFLLNTAQEELKAVHRHFSDSFTHLSEYLIRNLRAEERLLLDKTGDAYKTNVPKTNQFFEELSAVRKLLERITQTDGIHTVAELEEKLNA